MISKWIATPYTPVPTNESLVLATSKEDLWMDEHIQKGGTVYRVYRILYGTSSWGYMICTQLIHLEKVRTLNLTEHMWVTPQTV